jgi:hypothetical protein
VKSIGTSLPTCRSSFANFLIPLLVLGFRSRAFGNGDRRCFRVPMDDLLYPRPYKNFSHNPYNTRHTSLHCTRVTLFFIVINYTVIFIVVLGVIFCATQILDYTSALLIQSIDLDSTERNLS